MLEAPLDGVRKATVAFLVPPLKRSGYPLQQQGPDVLVFAYPFRSARITVGFRDLGDRRTFGASTGARQYEPKRSTPIATSTVAQRQGEAFQRVTVKRHKR